MDNERLQEYFGMVRRGDTEAFAAIYTDLKTPVYTVIYRIVGYRESAEDVMQELFLCLFRQPPDPSVKNMRAYIFRAAHNMALDRLRRDRHVSLDGLAEDSIAPTEARELDTRLDIDAAMRRLTDEERRVITLRINAELTLAETAKIMGKSVASVHRTYNRALDALKQLLQ